MLNRLVYLLTTLTTLGARFVVRVTCSLILYGKRDDRFELPLLYQQLCHSAYGQPEGEDLRGKTAAAPGAGYSKSLA